MQSKSAKVNFCIMEWLTLHVHDAGLAIQTSSAASRRTPTGASPAAAGDSVLVVASFWRASMIDCSTWISYGMDVAFCVLSNWPITTKLSAWVVAVESK